MEQRRIANRILAGHPEQRDHFGDCRVVRRTLLKTILKVRNEKLRRP
jgi:hypothetical protein